MVRKINDYVCQNPQQMVKWANKTEKLLFSLLNNPTLNANFKWQPLKVAALILIWKWKF